MERARKPPDSADEVRQAKAGTAKAEKELAEAQKAAADAVKAEADASKAKADADLAAFKARFGEVPASSYRGDITLKENAGKTEALLLAARRRHRRSHQDQSGRGHVDRSPDVPTFDNLMRFRVDLGIVQKAFDDMDRVSNAAREKEPADLGKPPLVKAARPPKKERAVSPIAAAGLALDAADKLLGFFRTDYTVGGIDVTGVTVHLPTLFNGNELAQTGADVIAELQGMALRRANSASTAAAHERLTAVWTDRAAKEADKEKKKEMTAAAEAHKRATDAISKATALYDTCFDKLSSPSENSAVVPIVADTPTGNDERAEQREISAGGQIARRWWQLLREEEHLDGLRYDALLPHGRHGGELRTHRRQNRRGRGGGSAASPRRLSQGQQIGQRNRRTTRATSTETLMAGSALWYDA